MVKISGPVYKEYQENGHNNISVSKSKVVGGAQMTTCTTNMGENDVRNAHGFIF